MKIYLDASRAASYNYPGEWEEIRNYAGFKKQIDQLVENRIEWIDVVSFDYDIAEERLTGVDCLKYLVEQCVSSGAPLPKIYIHSEHTGCYVEFENVCDLYRQKTEKQYVLESRRKFR